MAKTKYYAVKVGRKTGVFDTWEESKSQTDGYPGAKHKSFTNKDDAEAYILMDETPEKTGNPKDKTGNSDRIDHDKSVDDDLKKGYVVAFTDGSYSSTTNESSYGVVLITSSSNDNVQIDELASKVPTTKFDGSNNIIGEVFGVVNACEWCLKNNFDKISIYCDYQGLYEWASGSWRAKTPISEYYVEEIEKLSYMLDIKFTWVKGHDDIKYNEQADTLAKNALQGKGKFKSGSNYFSGAIANEEAVEDLLSSLKEVINYRSSKIENVNNESGLKRTLAFKKESVHLTYFPKNRSILVQGRPGYLFSYLLSLYAETLDVFNMVYTYSNAYESTIRKDNVEQAFEMLNIPANYPPSLKQLIKQSISSLDIKNVDEYDYGHYTVPAYRVLEGHIRYLCEESGVHLEEKFNFGGNLRVDDSTGRHVLTNSLLRSGPHKNEIEECFNLYYQKRHPLFHTGEIGIVDETLLIPTMQEAKERINEVLKLIQF